MKVLILCDYFEPVRFVGASRPTDFYKCFLSLGYSVDVITLFDSSWPTNSSAPSSLTITRIPVETDKSFKKYRFLLKIKKALKGNKNSKPNGGQNVNKSNHKEGFLDKIKSYFKALFSTNADICFGKCGAKAMYREFKQKGNSYDLIFTTYRGFSSLLAGEKIKHGNKNVKWICDFRDATYYKMFIKANKNYYKTFVNKHCLKSDLLVFASQGCLNDSIISKKYNGKIIVIENGFLSYNESLKEEHEKLIFLYCGSMYGDRHLYSFFEAVRKIKIKSKDIPIIINFCGDKDSFEIFFNEAKNYSVEDVVDYRGYLSKEDLMEEERRADVFLVSSWNYFDYSGVMTGKVFEYLSFKKPIIGHVSGDCPNSPLKRMINDNGLGLCSDDIEEGDYDKMYNYLNFLLAQFIKNGSVAFCGKKEFLDNYLRINQVKRMMSEISIENEEKAS